MGRAEIVSEISASERTFGYYIVTRKYGGREDVASMVSALNKRKSELQTIHDTMPVDTFDQIFQKNIVKLQIESITKRIEFLNGYFPPDQEVRAFCADLTGGLTGEVGTIDIPGEHTDEFNIVPGYSGEAAFDIEKHGEFYPAVSLGPWSAFYAKSLLPAVQKWRPKYRYGHIVAGSIDYDKHTCAVTLEAVFSSQQNIDVNVNSGLGTDIVDEEREIEYFRQDEAFAHPGFLDFAARYSTNPIATNTTTAAPKAITAEQYKEIRDICAGVHRDFSYKSDVSGYRVGDSWDIMSVAGTDTGDCEDFALTKMHRIIKSGILGPENMQILLCRTETGEYHAVLGIQTINYGFLVADNRIPATIGGGSGFISDIDLFKSYYRFERFQVAGSVWATVQVYEGGVKIEYMDCHSAPFRDNDYVIIEFENHDWNKPKVIGFVEDPASCEADQIFCFGTAGDFQGLGGYFLWGHLPYTDYWEVYGDMDEYSSRIEGKVTRIANKYLYTGGYMKCQSNPYHPDIPADMLFWGETSDDDSYILAWVAWIVPYQADVWDGIALTWTNVEDYPPPRRCNHEGWALGALHYIVCGSENRHGWPVFINNLVATQGTQTSDPHDDVTSYSQVDDAWTARQGAAVSTIRMQGFAIGRKGHITGGSTAAWMYIHASQPGQADWRNALTSHKVYNPTDDAWTFKQALPKWRWDGTGFSIAGDGYVVGGWVSTGLIDELGLPVYAWRYDQTLMKYTKEPDTWEYKQTCPVQADHQYLQSCASAVKFEKAYYIFHPETYPGDGQNAMQEYDPIADTWTTKPSHPGYNGQSTYKIPGLTAA